MLRLLALREVAPSVKRPLRRLWADTTASAVTYPGHYREVTDAKRALISWFVLESFCSLILPVHLYKHDMRVESRERWFALPNPCIMPGCSPACHGPDFHF